MEALQSQPRDQKELAALYDGGGGARPVSAARTAKLASGPAAVATAVSAKGRGSAGVPAAGPAQSGSIEPASWFQRLWLGSPRLGDNSEQAITFLEFYERTRVMSLDDLSRETDQPGFAYGGPDASRRWVLDPADPRRVIDMRHFLCVGPRWFAETQGLLVEVMQWLEMKAPSRPAPEKEHLRATAFDPQDFYSNALGKEFFRSYDPKGAPFAEQLLEFFKTRERLRR